MFSKETDQQIDAAVEDFIVRTKRSQAGPGSSISFTTAKLMRSVVNLTKGRDINVLMAKLKDIGHRLSEALPHLPVVTNVVRITLSYIREEYEAVMKQSDEKARKESIRKGQSEDAEVGGKGGPLKFPQSVPVDSSSSQRRQDQPLHRVLRPAPSMRALQAGGLQDMLLNQSMLATDQYSEPAVIKHQVIERINSLIVEIEEHRDDIAKQSVEHIHAGEVVLTFGCSDAVESFLMAAGKTREFNVVVCENAPTYDGHALAMRLAKAGIVVTVITDSAVFAYMSRVNKVVIGVSAVLANGGLISTAGMHLVALAAKNHSVPVVVVMGMYRLCPLYPQDADRLNLMKCPGPIIGMDDDQLFDYVTVHNPQFDYVPPELISLYITNEGGHSPSYVYRLMSEIYYPEDHIL